MEKESISLWYDQNRAKYADLVETLEQLIKTLLKQRQIPYHSVNGRVKDRDSYLQKFNRKPYTSPEQMMDVAGLRIITHTTIEVEQVCKMIEQQFTVDPANSGDKAADLNVDKVGYLSVHYVVSLTPERIQLPEYARFDGLRCEIQVRSLLQHAWAEIEHDRGYKFSGVLPESMQRKFYLIAGNLELIDLEFRAISSEIDQYAANVKEQAEQGQLNDIAIDSTSLLQFLNEYFKDYDTISLSSPFKQYSNDIIDELTGFGIESFDQLKDLLSQKPPGEWIATPHPSYIGILRDAMILKSPKEYFKSAWNRHWVTISPQSIDGWKRLGIDIQEVMKYIKIPPFSKDDNRVLIQPIE